MIILLSSLLSAFSLGAAPAVSETCSPALSKVQGSQSFRSEALTTEGLRQLQTAEIRTYLAGSTFEQREGSNSVPRTDLAEAFHWDGRYERYADRGGDDGTYTIRNHEVCVELPKKKPLCRHVFLDDQGNLWLRDTRFKTDARFVRYSKIQP